MALRSKAIIVLGSREDCGALIVIPPSHVAKFLEKAVICINAAIISTLSQLVLTVLEAE